MPSLFSFAVGLTVAGEAAGSDTTITEFSNAHATFTGFKEAPLVMNGVIYHGGVETYYQLMKTEGMGAPHEAAERNCSVGAHSCSEARAEFREHGRAGPHPRVLMLAAQQCHELAALASAVKANKA